MTPKERVLAGLNRDTPDRVPVFLRDLTLGLDIRGYSTPEVCAGGPDGTLNALKSAEAVCACHEFFKPDAVVGSIHDLGLDVEALGGRTDFPLEGVPRVVEPPFAHKRIKSNQKIPLMEQDGRLPGVLSSYHLVKQRLGHRAALAANVEGPITKAGIYRGADKLMRDFMTDPGYASEMVSFATDVTISHIRSLATVGLDFVFIAAATDGPVLVSPKIYLQYTIPNLKRIVEASAKLGLKVVFHPHGRFTEERFQDLVTAAIETGIAGFQFPENCDLEAAKHLWGCRIAILGGIDIARVLTPGPPEFIRRKVKECLKKIMPEGGYIFMPSCSLHRGDPLSHISTMMSAVLEFGHYGRT